MAKGFAKQRVKGKGKPWTAIYRDPDGKQVWRSGFKTKEEAETFLASVVTSKRDGSYVVASKTTFGEYLTEWIDGVDDLAPLSLVRYRQLIKTHLSPSLGRVQLQRTPRHTPEAALQGFAGRRALAQHNRGYSCRGASGTR